MKHIFILFCILMLFIQFCKKADNISPPEEPEYSDFNWLKIETIGFPPERAYHDMAYDSESDRVILFSGDSGPAALKMYSDTWAYDHNENKWKNMKPLLSPEERSGHAMSYDIESDRIILFGAGPRSNVYGFDTWAYDYNSNNWTQMNPAQSPPGRFGHRMVYDSGSDRIILFGGNSNGKLVNDTWSYDFNTNTWSEMQPSNNPPARQYHSMAYDAESDRIILFGGGFWDGSMGIDYTKQYDDTWAYDFSSNTWENMEPDIHPTGRIYSDMIYDEKWYRIILFGGGTQSFKEEYHGQGYGNETWQYDFNSNEWSEIIMKNPPSFRKKHKLVYDIESDRIILFGGDAWDLAGNTILYQNETWVLEK